MKKNMLTGFISVSFLTLFLGVSAFALTPQEIIKKTDSIRAPFDTFVMDVALKSPNENMSFRVYSRKGENSLVLFVAPPKEKGKLLLMSEENLWIYMPGSKRPIRISPAQRLMGGIANGDMARLRWSRDYDAKQIGEDEKNYEMELIAKNKSATYYRMEVTIEKNTFKPVRSKVYLQSGKLSKTINFTGFTTFSEKLMVTGLKFVDHLKKDAESQMTYSQVRQQEIPDDYFNTASLPRLSETLSEK